MKLTFKNLSLISLLFVFGNITEASSLVRLSGSPLPWQKKVTEKFLKDNELKLEGLVQWDEKNLSCIKRREVLLQICFEKGDIWVVQLKRKKLRSTIGRLISMSSSIEENAQRPSTRGPSK